MSSAFSSAPTCFLLLTSVFLCNQLTYFILPLLPWVWGTENIYQHNYPPVVIESRVISTLEYCVTKHNSKPVWWEIIWGVSGASKGTSSLVWRLREKVFGVERERERDESWLLVWFSHLPPDPQCSVSYFLCSACNASYAERRNDRWILSFHST